MIDPLSGGVGTHVLLIGVDEIPGAPPLKSASRSARLLFDWWNDHYVNPDAPLQNIELIVSGIKPSERGVSIEAINKAIMRWHSRATFHPENIAVFYFAGHGLETEGGYCLLAEDPTFKPEAGRGPTANQAIAVDPLLTAFRSGPARQLWMFDTSRQMAPSDAITIQPLPVLAPRSHQSRIVLRRLVLRGAHRGEVANAPSDAISPLAQAFFETMDQAPRPLDTAMLAESVASRVRESNPDRAGLGVELELTAPFVLLNAPPISEATSGTSDDPDREKRSAPAATTKELSKPRRTRKGGAKKQAPDRSGRSDSPASKSPKAAAAQPVAATRRTPRPDLEFLDDDAQSEIDSLGRGALAVVVARRLHAIWRKSNPPGGRSPTGDRSAFVMHLDAPWGGGKTTFANFVARVLNPFGYGGQPARFLRERYGGKVGLGALFVADPPADGEPIPSVPKEHRRPWIVVEYNAWRMEHSTPPWWTFYQVIRRGCFGAILREGAGEVDVAMAASAPPKRVRNALSWTWLWINELLWRLWTPKLVIPLIALVLSAIVFATSWQLGWTGSFGEPGKEAIGFNEDVWPARIMAGLGALTVIGGVVSLIMESLAPGVDPMAERIGLGRSDPMERFRRHFHKTMCRLRRPVLVVVDDLDRCKPAVIVDLVRGMQTILRSSRVVFLVLGDRNWLECAFEAVHTDMAKVRGGAEQSVGARFVEKAIQLSFLLPGLDSANQSTFVTALLRGGPDAAKLAQSPASADDLRAAARAAAKAEPSAAFDSGELRASVLETPEGKDFLNRAEQRLRLSSTNEEPKEQKELVAEARRQAAQIVNEEIAIQAAAAPSVETETAKRLEPLAPWLPGNPRQIKRILNGIALYHAAGLQHPTFSTAERWFQLALWIVLMTEWPATWRLLCASPELADIICDKDPATKLAATDPTSLPGSVPATWQEVERILNSSDLMALIAGKAGREGDKLDTAAVRDLLTLTPPNAKLPRLPERVPNKDGGERENEGG